MPGHNQSAISAREIRYDLEPNKTTNLIGSSMTKPHLPTVLLAFALGMLSMFVINKYASFSNAVSDSGEISDSVANAATSKSAAKSRSVVRDTELEEALVDAGFQFAFAFKFSGGVLLATLHPKDPAATQVDSPSADLLQDVDSSQGHLLVLIDNNGLAQICSRVYRDEAAYAVSRSPKVETALIWNDYPDGKGGPQPSLEVSHFSKEDFEREEPPGVSLLGGQSVFTLKWADS